MSTDRQELAELALDALEEERSLELEQEDRRRDHAGGNLLTALAVGLPLGIAFGLAASG